MERALAKSTRIKYSASLICFTEFCDKYNIFKNLWMPASAALLMAFIAGFSRKFLGFTVCTWLSGVRAWHVHYGAHWVGDAEWDTLVRSVAKKEDTQYS